MRMGSWGIIWYAVYLLTGALRNVKGNFCQASAVYGLGLRVCGCLGFSYGLEFRV